MRSTALAALGAKVRLGFQVGPGSVVSDGEHLQYTAAAFNGADLETGSIFSKDDDFGPDEERWRKRFKRRVKVISHAQPCLCLSSCCQTICLWHVCAGG